MKKRTILRAILLVGVFGFLTNFAFISLYDMSKMQKTQGCIKARKSCFIKIWVENKDNSRGELLQDEIYINKDEVKEYSSPTSRMIYVYKYSAGDEWNIESHAWLNDCNSPQPIP